jgi:molybdopterin-guanine dinucleotide biosynthesis protein A
MLTHLRAVVLAGGSGARLGGADKAAVTHEGRTLLEHCLAALAGAEEVVVVGEPVATSRPVAFAREDPPGGGPAAGLLAGVEALRGTTGPVAVLAVDMPFVTAATVERLLAAHAAAATSAGAFLVDAGGRRQLAGVLDAALLPRPRDRHNLPLHVLLGGLDLVPVPAVGREATDIDTRDDLEGLRSDP